MNKTNIRNAAGIAAAVTELTAAFGDGVVTAKLRSLWHEENGGYSCPVLAPKRTRRRDWMMSA